MASLLHKREEWGVLWKTLKSMETKEETSAEFAMIWVSKRSSPCLQKIADQD